MKIPNSALLRFSLVAVLLFSPSCASLSAPITAAPAPARMGCNVSTTAPPAASAVLNVEVVDANGPFHGSDVVTVSDMTAKPVASLECPDAWAHFLLSPGRYQIMASLGELHSDIATVDVRPEVARVRLMMRQALSSTDVGPHVVL